MSGRVSTELEEGAFLALCRPTIPHLCFQDHRASLLLGRAIGSVPIGQETGRTPGLASGLPCPGAQGLPPRGWMLATFSSG